VPGLALSFALAYFAASVITLVVLHRRLHGIDGARVTSTLVRTTIAGVVVGVVSWLVAGVIGWDTTVEAVASLAAGTAVGAVVYLALLRVMRVDELDRVLTLVPGLRSFARAPRGPSRV
jgi:putative peptidoglycan lipid II flippase